MFTLYNHTTYMTYLPNPCETGGGWLRQRSGVVFFSFGLYANPLYRKVIKDNIRGISMFSEV